jgi:glucose-6-phosphate 1-dehydrogenase
MKTKLVIFGITGDLSTRKLLPALEQIIGTGDFNDLMVVGISRRKIDTTDLLGTLPKLQERTSIFTMDLAEPTDYEELKGYLSLNSDEQALIYLAVPPAATLQIINFLAGAGLNTPNIKLLFEKPFGFDLVSAQELISRTKEHFTEDQIYRIDHYMAKEVAMEVIKLRTNAESRHSWDKLPITAVTIQASETIGVENRASFYEQTGALRDVVQGHLLQLLSLVLMDIPADFTLDKLPTYRLAALKDILPADPTYARRAQYDGYQEEVKNIGSMVETFVDLTLRSTDKKWQNVPLRLITGKQLNKKVTSISIEFEDSIVDTFEEHAMAGAKLPNAYERVLTDAIAGRKSIFTTSPEILRAWEILQPIQDQWMMEDFIQTYPQGSNPSSF